MLTTATAVMLGCLLAIGGAAAAMAMPLYISVAGAETLTLDVESSDSIQQVKHKILDQTEIPVDDQNLYFEGTALEGGRTLGDYNIQRGSTLTLLLPPAWTDAALAVPTIAEAYSDAVSARGGNVQYAITAGSLPLDLSLNAETGAITGTPSVPDPYGFTVSATNEVGSITQEFSGEIATAATPTPTPEPSQEPAPRTTSTPEPTQSPVDDAEGSGEELPATGPSLTLSLLLASAGLLLVGAGAVIASRTVGTARQRGWLGRH